MITNESFLVAKNNIYQLNRLVGLIFGNIKFWRAIRADGCQNLTEDRMDLKMVSNDRDGYS